MADIFFSFFLRKTLAFCDSSCRKIHLYGIECIPFIIPFFDIDTDFWMCIFVKNLRI